MDAPIVAVIGGGITGLTVAFYLQRAGVQVTLYEAGDRVGGVIRSKRENGFLAEYGPNTILETSPLITQLVRDAGLSDRRLEPNPMAGARYVVRYRRPIEMPGSPVGFFASPLFSLRAKWSVVCEPFVPARRDGFEESVAEFVTRRLGREFLDHAIDAMVAGVYAGDPAKLSVPQAFPKLAALEEKFGSLIKGQIFGARERKKRGEISKDRAPKFSFDEGLQVLPDTLAAKLGRSVQTGVKVIGIRQAEDGWTLDLEEAGRRRNQNHAAVIYAGTAHQLAGISLSLGVQVPQAVNLSPFSHICHPPVTSVVLGFRREDVDHPCQGFGALIPKVEGFQILGTIFSSSLFPNRAPAGHLTLTSYVGGERAPDLATLPVDDLIEVTMRDLRVLFGVRGGPVFRHCALYKKAIPQYNVGYGRFRQMLTGIESQAPGLHFAGHYRDGISLGDSIVSGCRMAEKVACKLKN